MPTVEPLVVPLKKTNEYQPLLNGIPQTRGMKSGRVCLLKGDCCGEHSTNEREEMLVFLSGNGQAIIENKDILEVGEGRIAYIPPHTVHNIKNTGDEPLVYIYCVVPVDDRSEKNV